MRGLAICIVAALAVPTPAPQDPADSGEVLQRFLAADEQRLVSYQALRHMSVVARGGKMRASMVAETWLDPVSGFRYVVREEEGSGFLRSRVLHPVLEAERLAQARDKGSHGALTGANYVFTVGSLTAEGTLQVGIKPRRKDELLMDGSIYLQSDADLVRMEGLLVKRPSFWTRKVHIVRHYARIAGMRVPVSTGSTADILFAGQSTFSMAYEYETINGTAIDPGVARSAAASATGVRAR